MLQRVIYAAAVLLAVQLGVAAVLQVCSSSGLNAALPDALFASFDPAKISTVQISAGDGKKVTLSKNGKSWLLPDSYSAPADSGQIEDLLQKVAKAKQGLAVASTKGAAKRFKTADSEFERHIVFKEGDKAAADFYLGTSAGFRQSYARLNGKDEVVSIPVSGFEAEADADKWLDKGLARLNSDELKKLELADIVLTRQDKDWKLDGAAEGEVIKDEVNKTLDKLTGLSAEGVIDPAKAEPLFQQPAVQFTATKNDNSTVTCALAKQDDHYVLKSSASPRYLKIGTWQAEELAKLKRANLLVKKEEKAAAKAEAPPAPAPAAAPAQAPAPPPEAKAAE